MAMVDQIIGAESGGNPYARNSRSSAGGAGQFIDSTWLQMLKRHRPDIAQGKSDAQLLQLKFDPNLSREMTQRYADDNSAFLRSKGIEPTPGNSYLAHFAGPGGAAAIHADPGATVEALLGPRAVQANPFLKGKTGQDVIDWANRKMTPAEFMAKNLRQRYAPAAAETAPAETGATGAVGMDRLRAALSGKSYDPDKITQGQRLQQQGQAIGGNATNWLGALGGTLVSGLGGYLEGREKEGQQAYQTQLRDTLSNAADPIEAARALMSSPDPQQQAAGIQMFSKLSTARGGNESYSKNPIWGTDDEGRPAIIQVSDRGNSIQTQLPEGINIGKDPIKVDAGTHFVLLDPVTRQPIGQVEKQLQKAEEQKTIGKDQGEAKQALPGVETQTNRIIELIDRLDKSPARSSFTGYSGYLPNVSTEANDYQGLLDQVGDATFLQGFESLRGSGAITEAEGAKALGALSRLQVTAPSDEGYQSALDDARQVMREILINARKRAGVEVKEEDAGNKKRLKYNRETGKFE